MKILIVFGTRPEALKLLPVFSELKKQNIPTVICSTGQHGRILKQALHGVKPDYDLKLMRKCHGLNDLLSKAIQGVDSVISKEKPDAVLVQGDTISALAGALAGHLRGIKVGHIEAGLRTHDKSQPFPEESNRVLIDAISDLCFAATECNKQNLLNEGKPGEKIYVTGNTIIDFLRASYGPPAGKLGQAR